MLLYLDRKFLLNILFVGNLNQVQRVIIITIVNHFIGGYIIRKKLLCVQKISLIQLYLYDMLVYTLGYSALAHSLGKVCKGGEHKENRCDKNTKALH